MKTLPAVALLLAFLADAQGQTGVTVYGIVDAGVTRETGSANGSIVKLATGVQSGNRLGFKGSEDLGGGLTARFQIESGFNLDTGTSRQGALFGRQSWVGLSGSLGSLNMGRQINPLKTALDSIDPFSTGLPGSTMNLMNASLERTNNSIAYYTSNFAGFSASLLYGFGEVPGASDRNRTVGLSANYAANALSLVLAYDQASNGNATTPATNTTKLTLLGGTYKFDKGILHLAYEFEKDDAGVNYRDCMAGITVPVTPAGTVLVSFIDKHDMARAGRDAKQWAVGYIYSLSKRTNLYTSYGYISNDRAATFFVKDSSGGGSTDQVVGASSSAMTIGMRHRF